MATIARKGWGASKNVNAALLSRRNQKLDNIETNPFCYLQIVDPQPSPVFSLTPGTPRTTSNSGTTSKGRELSTSFQHRATSASPVELLSRTISEIARLDQVTKDAVELLHHTMSEKDIIARMGDATADAAATALATQLAKIMETLNKCSADGDTLKVDVKDIKGRVSDLENTVHGEKSKTKPQQQQQQPPTIPDPQATTASASAHTTPDERGQMEWNEDGVNVLPDEESEENQWNMVVRRTSKTTRKLLPYLREDDEDDEDFEGYHPSRQEVRRHNQRRIPVLKEIDEKVRAFDDLKRQGLPSRSAWDGHVQRRRDQEIKSSTKKMEGYKNPITGKTDRWRSEAIDDPSYNIYINKSMYNSLQEVLQKQLDKGFPNAKTKQDVTVAKACLQMKREILLGPFKQHVWAAEDRKVGGMEHRPTYLLNMVCEHLRWFLDMSDHQLKALNVVSIKPTEEAMTSLYPSMLRVTLMTKEQADHVLMMHAQNEGVYGKKESRARIMTCDEMMLRYNQLATVASLKKKTFSLDTNGRHRMFGFITYSCNSLELVTYRTNNHKKEWALMRTPSSITAGMWETNFSYKKGQKLEAYQHRILQKNSASKIDFGEVVGGKWTLPTIKPIPDATIRPVVRGHSTMNESNLQLEEEDNSKKKKTDEDEEQYSSDDIGFDRLVPENLRSPEDDIQSNLSYFQLDPDSPPTNSRYQSPAPGEISTGANVVAYNVVNSMETVFNCDKIYCNTSNVDSHDVTDRRCDRSHHNVYCCNEDISNSPVTTALNDTRFLDNLTNETQEHEILSSSPADSGEPGNSGSDESAQSEEQLAENDTVDSDLSEYLVDDEYSVVNESRTHKLEMRIKIPEAVLRAMCSVILQLLKVTHTYKVVNTLIRVEEVKSLTNTIRISQCSETGESSAREAHISFNKQEIRIWAKAKTVISQRNFVEILWSEIMEKMLESTMKTEVIQRSEFGPCQHCGRETYTWCAVCKNFLHTNCSNRGTCKKRCEKTSTRSFVRDNKTLESQIFRTFYKNAERQEKSAQIDKLFSNLKTVAAREAEKVTEPQIVPGTIVEDDASCSPPNPTIIAKTGDEINILDLLDITEEDLDREVTPRDNEEIFSKNFPDGWTEWHTMRNDKRFKNLFFLDETVVDGNCFYHSIALILTTERDYSLPADPQKMREKLVSQFHDLNIMNQWVDTWHGGDKSKKNSLIQQHMKCGKMTDDSGFVVQGAAEILGREIRVVKEGYFNSGAPRWYELIKPEQRQIKNPNPIWLAYSRPGQHFRALFQKNRYMGIMREEQKEADQNPAAATPSGTQDTPGATTTSQSSQGNSGQSSRGNKQDGDLVRKKIRRTFKPKLTPPELDERRRRRELAKSDVVMKLEAAETHVINLTRSLAQMEEKSTLLGEKIGTLEKYAASLEVKNLRLEAKLHQAGLSDPGDTQNDPVFTPKDNYNITGMRDQLTSLVQHVLTLTSDVKSLSMGNINLISGKNSAQNLVKESTISELNQPPGSPSRMTLGDKIKRFDSLNAPAPCVNKQQNEASGQDLQAAPL